MARESQIVTLRKSYRGHISESGNLVKTWNILKPFVVKHVGPGYTPIPYLVDTKAYQIGHIFIQQSADVKCFCVAPHLKVLGPIRDFLVQEKSNPRWLDADIPVIKTTGDDTHFRVLLDKGKQSAEYRMDDCYFLDKAPDMSVEGEVTIDRTSHEDLGTAGWFGLISGAILATTSHLFAKKNSSERTFCIGERPHTVLFKYEICRMDKDGSVHRTSAGEMEGKWLPVEERNMDALPLTEFVSQSARINS
ncbi:unnamed protein product [Xylocopa violacea]|uniref:Uncharacterized protein n=1 Tax=Xylocopa violacea TaxID=135666 RepID=A0ABP1PAW2_XYLVO